MKLKEFQTDEKGQIIMSFKNVQLYNEQAGLFATPQLNDQLYLHYKGFHRIQNLEQYTAIKALYLNNNAIRKIQNLNGNKQIISLYLNNNLIEKIEGIENLSQLVMLNLSHNRIQKIEGLKGLDKLNNLILSTNRLTTYEGIIGIQDVPSLLNLDLSNNQIQANEDILHIFEKLPNLACLYLKGSPLQRTTKNYRKTIVSSIKNLTFLDDRPISVNQRRLIEAWVEGGIEMQNLEKTKIYEQKQQQNKKQIAEYQKMVAPVRERRKYIYEELSKIERQQLNILQQQNKQLTNNQQNKIRKEEILKRVQVLQTYLQWLEQEISNTTVIEGCKPQDFAIQKIRGKNKFVNFYSQAQKRKYQQRDNAVLRQKQEKRKQQQQQQLVDDQKRQKQQPELVQQTEQDQQQKQLRILLSKFHPQFQPLLQSFLQKNKFDFQQVYPQFNMASANIFKRLGQQPVRFQAKQLQKIWTAIEQKNRNKLQELD